MEPSYQMKTNHSLIGVGGYLKRVAAEGKAADDDGGKENAERN